METIGSQHCIQFLKSLNFAKNQFLNFQFFRAEEAFLEIIKNEQGNAIENIEAHLYLSNIYIKWRHLKKAREHLAIAENSLSASQKGNKLPLYYVTKAILLGFEGSLLSDQYYDLAFVHYKKDDPMISYLYTWWLATRRRRTIKEISDSTQSFLKIIQENFPFDARQLEAYQMRKASILSKEKKYLKEIQLYKTELKKLSNKKNLPWARYYINIINRFISSSYLNVGDFNLCIVHGKKFLEHAKDYLPAHHYLIADQYKDLAEAYQMIGNFEMSNSYHRMIYENYKNQEVSRYKLGGLLDEVNRMIKNDNYIRADSLLQYIISASNPSNHSIAKYIRINVKIELGDIESANNLLKEYKNEYAKYFEINPAFRYLIHLPEVRILRESKEYQKLEFLFKNIENESHFFNEDYMSLRISIVNEYIKYLVTTNRYEIALKYIYTLLDEIKKSDLVSGSLNSQRFKTIIDLKELKGDLLIKKKEFSTALNIYKECLNQLYENEFKSMSLIDEILHSEYKERLTGKIIESTYSVSNIPDKKTIEYLFNLVETSKTNQLLKSLNRNTAYKDLSISDSLLSALNSYQRQAIYLKNKMNVLNKKIPLSTSDSTALANLRRIELENKENLRDLMIILEEHNPEYYDAVYNTKIATIKSVQDNLRFKDGLIEFFASEKYLYAFSISKDSSQLMKLDGLNNESIDQLLQNIQPENFAVNQKKGFIQFNETSHKLYQSIMKEPLDFLQASDVSKIYIVPHKTLNYIPFEILISELSNNNVLNYSSLKYLIKDYDISYGYSATILFRQENSGALSEEIKLLAVAPSYKKILKDSLQLASLGKFREGFEELKYNQSEAEEIGKYFNSTLLTGENATKESFSNIYKDHDVIHFAMHALVDNQESDNSKLVFASQSNDLNHNMLHNYELYNMQIPSKLAVLSACNTGYGKIESGEGIMSLARAFTYAGTKSVITSHWRVDDQSSSIIMKYFYENLSKGMEKDASLRFAKLKFLEEALPSQQHPFHWNNYVLIGSPTPLISKGRWLSASNLILLIFLVSIIVIFAYLIFFRQKS